MKLNPHLQRILTSVLLLPILGWAVYHGGLPLGFVISVVATLGLLEFYTMFWPGSGQRGWKAGGILLGLAIIWSPLAWSGSALVGLALLATALAFLFSYDQDKRPDTFVSSQIFLFGLLYLPFILRLARTLEGPEIILVLLCTFATDTGAYYTGSTLGGPKIWPAISPKKTWAGSIGGLVLCILISVATGLVLGSASTLSFALLGIGLNLAAQAGDFFESALKRWRGVKDSGRLLPGHGGILDRIDSLLFVLPLYCGLAALFPFFG